MKYGQFGKKHRFFDSGSFTPIYPRARREINRILKEQGRCAVGNPASAHYSGRRSAMCVSNAQKQIAEIYQIKEGNVVFTSGATDSNFIALKTAIIHALRNGTPLSKMHILVGGEEHTSITAATAYFQEMGVHFSAIPVPPKTSRSTLSAEYILPYVRKETICLSLQYVNSQHGIVQPIAQIVSAIRSEYPSLFIHTDAAQATAYLNCSPTHLRVDAVTIDSAKTFGPQGVGALLFQNYPVNIGHRGGEKTQDEGIIRSGTPPVALISGFAEAMRITRKNRKENVKLLQKVRSHLTKKIAEFSPDAYIHGINKNIFSVRTSDWDHLAPHLVYISFPNTHHPYLATLLDTSGFSVSTGTACAGEWDGALRIGLLPTTALRSATALARSIQKNLPIARSLS